MKRILFFLLFGISTLAQNPNSNPTMPQKFDAYFGQDHLGAAYFGHREILYKTTSNESFQYRNLKFGKMESVDFFNPLQPLVFYSKHNAAVILDSQLNEIQQIQFSRLEIPLTVLACRTASQNQLWIYDQNEMKIGLYDRNQNRYRSLTQPLQGTIVHHSSSLNYFYWIDESGSAFRLDVYGKIEPLGDWGKCKGFQVVKDSYTLILKSDSIEQIEFNSQTKKRVIPVAESVKSFWYSPEFLTIFTDGEITKTKLNLP